MSVTDFDNEATDKSNDRWGELHERVSRGEETFSKDDVEFLLELIDHQKQFGCPFCRCSKYEPGCHCEFCH